MFFIRHLIDRSQRTHCPLHQVKDGQDADEKTSQFAHPGPGQTEIAWNSIENQGKLKNSNSMDTFLISPPLFHLLCSVLNCFWTFLTCVCSLVLNRMPPKMKSSASTVLWPRLVVFYFLVIFSLFLVFFRHFLWLRQHQQQNFFNDASCSLSPPSFRMVCVGVFSPVELLTCVLFFQCVLFLSVSTTHKLSYNSTRS